MPYGKLSSAPMAGAEGETMTDSVASDVAAARLLKHCEGEA
jgi:hypothetical protein